MPTARDWVLVPSRKLAFARNDFWSAALDRRLPDVKLGIGDLLFEHATIDALRSQGYDATIPGKMPHLPKPNGKVDWKPNIPM